LRSSFYGSYKQNYAAAKNQRYKNIIADFSQKTKHKMIGNRPLEKIDLGNLQQIMK